MEAAVLLALLVPCGAAAQRSVLAGYDTVNAVVTVTWNNHPTSVDRTSVTSRLLAAFELELRKDGVRVRRKQDFLHPTLDLRVLVASGGESGIVYTWVAVLSDAVVPLQAAKRIVGDASLQHLSLHRALGELQDAGCSGIVWETEPGIGTARSSDTLTALEAEARGAARAFARAWLAVHAPLS